jgi:hypothetical protein
VSGTGYGINWCALRLSMRLALAVPREAFAARVVLSESQFNKKLSAHNLV